MKNIILIVISILLPFALLAQSASGHRSYTITVNEPGEIVANVNQLPFIDTVEVKGPINGADIEHLKNLMLRYKISVLDLGNAPIEGNKISDEAFRVNVDGYVPYNKSYLKKLILPDGVEEIGQYAFDNMRTLKEIVLPANLKTLGEYCFLNCMSLESIELPDGVTQLPIGCFSNCSSLKTVLLPASLKRIGAYAFEGAGMVEITLPEGLEVIDRYAFKSAKLRKLSIPESCTDIRLNAFEDNKELTDIEIPSTMTEVPTGVFTSCTGLSKLNIPEGVRVIGSRAFYGCSSLGELTLPSTLEKVSSRAFYGFCAETVVLPENMKSLGPDAFYGTIPVSGIYVKNPIPAELYGRQTAGNSVVDKFGMNILDEYVPIYIPKGSYMNYSNSMIWQQLKNYIEIESDEFPTSGIENIAVPEGGVRIYSTASGEFVIEGTGEAYTVCDINGRIVRAGVCDGLVSVRAASGVYIVKAGNVVRKVVIE